MSSGSTSTRNARAELEGTDAVFRALAHPSRRHILLVLRLRGGSMTAGEIARRFSCRWPTTSRHLKELEAAALVQVDRRGRERIYKLDGARLHAVAGEWLRWFDPSPPKKKGSAPSRQPAKRT